VQGLTGEIHRTVQGAIAAAGAGLRDGESLMRALRTWARRTGYDRGGESELPFEGPIEIRFEGKRVEVCVGKDGEPISLGNPMAEARMSDESN